MSFPYKRVCSSHKPPHEGDATILFENFLAAFDRQKNEILAHLESGKTLSELVEESPFYKNRFFDLKIQGYFEEHMIKENLDELLEEGLALEEKEIYIAK